MNARKLRTADADLVVAHQAPAFREFDPITPRHRSHRSTNASRARGDNLAVTGLRSKPDPAPPRHPSAATVVWWTAHPPQAIQKRFDSAEAAAWFSPVLGFKNNGNYLLHQDITTLSG